MSTSYGNRDGRCRRIQMQFFSHVAHISNSPLRPTSWQLKTARSALSRPATSRCRLLFLPFTSLFADPFFYLSPLVALEFALSRSQLDSLFLIISDTLSLIKFDCHFPSSSLCLCFPPPPGPPSSSLPVTVSCSLMPTCSGQ